MQKIKRENKSKPSMNGFTLELLQINTKV